MCGIAGLNYSENSQERLGRMNSCISHRGPDWTGTFEDDNISLGHTLLAIRGVVDISKQPVIGPEWVLAFNGQIYNTREQDTNFLYKTIEKYGWKFTDHVRGMFAIALYNKKEGVVRLYRDPSGQKILYYYEDSNNFIFASEIKAILENPIERRADKEAVMVSAMLGYVPGDKTIIDGVKKVRPSEYITYNFNTKKLSKEFFKQENDNYFQEDPKSAFRQLVDEHLQSKAPVSINLSGGLDSSLLLHEMREVGHSIHSYSTRFDVNDEKINGDAVLAKRLAADYGTEHTEIFVTREMFQDNFKYAYELVEEPNYNVSLPVYLLTARKEGIHGDMNRVVLSGDGGDEIFGGYSAYQESLRFQKFERLLTPWLFSFIKNMRSGTNFNLNNPDERWLFFKVFTENFLKEDGLAVTKRYIKESTKDWVKMYGSKRGPIYDLMVRDRVLWMAGENFIRSDKLYMSESMEMRSPLSYQPFRHYIDKLIPAGKYVGKTNKVFLRELYRGRLPDYIVDRRDKTGWRAPVAAYYDKNLKALFLEILSSPYLTSEIIDWQSVRKEVEVREGWPGKAFHLYISLAILAEKYKINL